MGVKIEQLVRIERANGGLYTAHDGLVLTRRGLERARRAMPELDPELAAAAHALVALQEAITSATHVIAARVAVDYGVDIDSE